MNDLQILIVSVVVATFGYVLFKRLRKHAAATLKSSDKQKDSGLCQVKRVEKKPEPVPVPVPVQAKEISDQKTHGTKKPKAVPKERQTNYKHKWLVTNLKGQSANILDFNLSENGKYLASCAEDRSIMIWFSKDFTQKEHKTLRTNIQFDHASRIRWSPDSKAFLVFCENTRELQVHKMIKRPEDGNYFLQHALGFKIDNPDEGDVIGMELSTNGKFILTCTSTNKLTLYNLKGDILTRSDTCQVTTYCAKISPCGRYVATSGFTPDVKIWEVKFGKSGEFEKITRAFELTGHTSGIYDFDFTADSSQVATLGKDGNFRVFSINVDYHIGQDPVLVKTAKVEKVTQSSKIRLSNDGRVIVVSNGSNLTIYSVAEGKKLDTIESIHTEPISQVAFDTQSNWIITSGDKHIRVFLNIPGLQLTVLDLKEKLKKAPNEGAKDRLLQQISIAQQQMSMTLEETG